MPDHEENPPKSQPHALPQYLLDELDQQTLIAAAAALRKNIMATVCSICACDREQRVRGEARRLTLEIDLDALENINFARAKHALADQAPGPSTTNEES